jgi:hypothetical protein
LCENRAIAAGASKRCFPPCAAAFPEERPNRRIVAYDDARPPRRVGAQYADAVQARSHLSAFRRRTHEELIVPLLEEFRTIVTLAPAKSGGLADLGAPVDDATRVKKGRVHEFAQVLSDGKIGRRFQDLRIFAVNTVEAAVPSAKLFVQFEVFGDDTAAPASGVGFEAILYAGSQQLAHLSSSSLFLPYANFWHANRFAFEASVADLDQADRCEFIAKSEEVRSF